MAGKATAGRKAATDPLDPTAGAEQVVDDLPYLFPGKDPHAGLTITGKVVGYRELDGEHGKFPVCDLAGATIFEPGAMYEDGEARSVRVGTCGVIVSRWILNTLTPAKFKAGSFVAVKFVGMQGRARELHVFALDERRARNAWNNAIEDAEGAYQGARKSAPGDDDLPF